MPSSAIDTSVWSFVLMVLSFSLGHAQGNQVTPIPANSRQLALVVTDSMAATKGSLFRFERKGVRSPWEVVGERIPVVLGRNGLAWGVGLHTPDSLKVPVKREGDGRSPAGVFALGSAFGYRPMEELKGLKIPYTRVTRTLECVDDSGSRYYNRLVFRDNVGRVDWHSSEKMLQGGVWYELGVVVDQNTRPTMKGAGSCIFLHNWSSPDETSAGCTEMEPRHMKEVVHWLDSSRHPVLVQLTKQLFDEYRLAWELPGIPARGRE